jgi:hypothetical protein
MRNYIQDDLCSNKESTNFNIYREYKYIAKFKNKNEQYIRIFSSNLDYFYTLKMVFNLKITGIEKIN